VSRLPVFARRHGLDALIVFGALESALEVARSTPAPRWFAAPASALLVLSLLLRRRWPFGAPAALWVMAAALSCLDGRVVTDTASIYVAGLAAAFMLGQVADGARRRLGLGVVLAAAAIVVANDPGHGPGEFLFVPGLFVTAWLAGFALRERAAQVVAAESRARDAEREREHAVFEERVRIARELHDVVAHHVSMMGVQAGAARLVIDADADKAKQALAAIERSSREAVAELHRLLGFLRQAGDSDTLGPQPGLGELDRLAASLSDSALAVEVSVEGEQRSLPPTVDVSAYRIVQEALTNTLKHSVASRAEVHLRYWPDELEVEVVDDGRPTAAPSTASSGLGLIGMRERATLHGGQLSAGPAAGGGFAVKARLPAP
jgi:signal transduction histidine kinase